MAGSVSGHPPRTMEAKTPSLAVVYVVLHEGPFQSLRVLRGPCISDFRGGETKLGTVLGTV